MTSVTRLAITPVTRKAAGINTGALQTAVDEERKTYHTGIITGINQDADRAADISPSVRFMILTSGGVLSATTGELLTMTKTSQEMPMFPAASFASAVRTAVPSVV